MRNVTAICCLIWICFSASTFAQANDAVDGQGGQVEVVSPGWSKDDFNASIAAGKNNLWVAKVGREANGSKRLKVLRFRAGKWNTMPGRPKAETVHLKTVKLGRSGEPSPCVAYSTMRLNVLKCFEAGKWRFKTIPGAWRSVKRSVVNGLAVRGGNLVMLMNSCLEKKPRCIARVLSLQKSRLVPTYKPIQIDSYALWSFVSDVAGSRAPLRVTMVENLERRAVWTWTGRGWSESRPLPPLDGGEARSAAFLNRRIYFPVNESLSGDFVFSVWSQNSTRNSRWNAVGGRPLNQGFGNAQGDVFIVGRTVWAVWSEFDVANAQVGDLFPVKTFAAKLKPDGKSFGNPLTLRDSKQITAFFDQVVQFQGQPVFLYTRQWKRTGGMHVTVDFRSTKQIRTDMKSRRR